MLKTQKIWVLKKDLDHVRAIEDGLIEDAVQEPAQDQEIEDMEGLHCQEAGQGQLVLIVVGEDLEDRVTIGMSNYSLKIVRIKHLKCLLTRFQRRSPAFRGGRNFRDRFRRSRSTSRGRFERHDRRRFNDSRRSRSESPQQNRMDNNNYNQQLSQQQMGGYSNDGYGNVAYMPNAPQAPQFPGAMNQFNSYEFQGFPPPAPNFNMNINCPAPPGMNESWAPQPSMQMEEMEKEEKLKREGLLSLSYFLIQI